MYYMNCFFIYSILGFLFEHLIYIIMGHHGDSGILYGPWTPVYGVGIILIILVSNFIFKNLHASKLLQMIVIFISIIVLLTTIELLGGILIEKIFHQTFWNYSNLKFHIGKYIALEISLAWGFLSIFVIYVIKPLLDHIILKIPTWISWILLTLFLIDCGATLLLKTKAKDYLIKVFK